MPVPNAPTSPANPYAPMGFNIPAPVMPTGATPAPAPVGMPANYPQMPAGPQMQQVSPQQMLPQYGNIPGRIDGGPVTIPGYGGGGTTDLSNLPPDDAGSGTGGSTGKSQDDNHLIVAYGKLAGYDITTPEGMALAEFNLNKDPNNRILAQASYDNELRKLSPGGGGSPDAGIRMAELAQKALEAQQARDDLWAKMQNENAISQNTAQQNYEDKQAQLQEQNRQDTGTLGLKAFDAALAASRMVGGTYDKNTGSWKANTGPLTFDASAAAGPNLPMPVLTKPNIPSMQRPY